jgi:hypothetical protein
MPLLFVDMLGVKARWQQGGRVAAEEAFQHFWGLVAYAVRGESTDTVSAGMLESDSFAIDCKDTGTALRIAQRLYRAAFLKTLDSREDRTWIRGVLLNRTESVELRRLTRFKTRAPIDLMLYSGDLLDAIAAEKSGFRGMRLLVDETLVTDALRKQWRLMKDTYYFVPFSKLRHSFYPVVTDTKFCDYLWMAALEEREKSQMNVVMARRLRYASKNSEESLHAAATQVMFHEVTAMLIKVQANDRRLRAINEAAAAQETSDSSETSAAKA